MKDLFKRFMQEEDGDLAQWITVIILVVLSVIIFTFVRPLAEDMIEGLLQNANSQLEQAMSEENAREGTLER